MIANIDIDNLIRGAYDQAHARANGHSMTLAEVRDDLLPRVVQYLEHNDRDFEAEARLLIDSVLRRERPRRANQLRRDLEYILDYLTNPDEAAFGIEACMGRAYPLGTRDGEDKLLAWWTADDLRGVLAVRVREADQAQFAADELKTTVEALIHAMGANDAKSVGALVEPEPERLAA